VENRPLVNFIRNYIWDSSGVFPISSLVRISMTSFASFTLLFVQKCSCLHNKKKLHGGLKIWIIFSSGKKQHFTHSLRSFVKYCFYHSKIEFISSRRRVISSIYYIPHYYAILQVMTHAITQTSSLPQSYSVFSLAGFYGREESKRSMPLQV